MSISGGASTAERGFGEMIGGAKGKLDNLQKNLAGALMPKFPGLPVGKFDDLSIGVDLHPTVVPPSPMMAVPHIGKVYDIMAAIMAAIVSNIPVPPPGAAAGGIASVALNLLKAMAPSVSWDRACDGIDAVAGAHALAPSLSLVGIGGGDGNRTRVQGFAGQPATSRC